MVWYVHKINFDQTSPFYLPDNQKSNNCDKQWRDCESLLGDCETYAEAFHSFTAESADAVNYHNRLQQYQGKDKTIRMEIDKCRTQMEIEEQNSKQRGT